jgi:hypothetical protein
MPHGFSLDELPISSRIGEEGDENYAKWNKTITYSEKLVPILTPQCTWFD